MIRTILDVDLVVGLIVPDEVGLVAAELRSLLLGILEDANGLHVVAFRVLNGNVVEIVL